MVGISILEKIRKEAEAEVQQKYASEDAARKAEHEQKVKRLAQLRENVAQLKAEVAQLKAEVKTVALVSDLSNQMETGAFLQKKQNSLKAILDQGDNQFVLVDTTQMIDGSFETLVFSCDEEGNILDFKDLDCDSYTLEEEAMCGHQRMIENWTVSL